MKYITAVGMAFTMLALATSCAAGSATSGYAVAAHSADGLSPAAEDHVIQRAKSEVIKELAVRGLLKNQEASH